MELVGEGPSCGELWNGWMREDPPHPWMLQIKERMKSYTKEDWQSMIKEANEFVEALVEINKNNVPRDGVLAKLVFDLLVEHYDKWFIPFDRNHISWLAMLSKYSVQKSFFDKFYPGTGDCLSDIIKAHIDSLEVKNDTVSS